MSQGKFIQDPYLNLHLRLRLQKGYVKLNDPYVNVFLSRHVTKRVCETKGKLKLSQSNTNGEYDTVVRLQSSELRPEIDAQYALIGFCLYDTFEVKDETGKSLGYNRYQPMGTGYISFAHVATNTRLQNASFTILLSDNTVSDISGSKKVAHVSVSIDRVEIMGATIRGQFDPSRMERERQEMQKLIGRYMDTYTRVLKPAEAEDQPMHVPIWFGLNLQMPAAVFCMDIPQKLHREDLALLERGIRVSIAMNGWNEDDYITVAAAQLDRQNIKKDFDYRFNRVMKVLVSGLCVFSNACDYTFDHSGDKDVERFIDVLRTLLGDCEDLAKLATVFAWVLRLLEPIPQLLQSSPLLYWSCMALRIQVPCMVTTTATSAAMGPVGGTGTTPAPEAMNHMPAACIPRFTFCAWFKCPHITMDQLWWYATRELPVYPWEIEFSEVWMMEGTSYCTPGLKPFHLYYAPERRAEVTRLGLYREYGRACIENTYTQFSNWAIEVTQFNPTATDTLQCTNEQISTFYKKPNCLWTPILLHWGIPHCLAIDFYLGYRKTPQTYGVWLRDIVAKSPEVTIVPTYTVDRMQLETMKNLMAQEEPLVFPTPTYTPESSRTLTSAILSSNVVPSELSHSDSLRTMVAKCDRKPPIYALLSSIRQNPLGEFYFFSYRINHVNKLTMAHADAIASLLETDMLLGAEVIYHSICEELYVLEVRLYPNYNVLVPPASLFTNTGVPMQTHRTSMLQNGYPSIYLTTPHSFCTPEEEASGHACDFGASRAASKLQQELGGPDTAMLLSANIRRSECDLNREQCYNTTFHHQLDALPSPTLLLDIHSYPPERGSSSYAPYEMVVLLDEGHLPSASFSRALTAYLQQSGVSIAMMQGIHNFIQDKFHQKNVIAVLLEFNEGLTDQRMRQLASLIATFVKSRV